MTRSTRNTRRSLLCSGAAAGLAYAAGGPVARAQENKNEIPVSPTEDLMREHGVLSRLLLVYQASFRPSREEKALPTDAVKKAASIIRSFIQDYHEKQEEEYVFPRFEKAGKLVDLVKVLKAQHDAGRKVTDTIQELAAKPDRSPEERRKLADSVRLFIRMYRPHKAREDTVLFPALHEIMTPKEYDDMGEKFEAKEHQLFGKNGFEDVVGKVAAIEKQLGIYDLAEFTPPG